MNLTWPGRRPANTSRSRPSPRSTISEAASRGRTIAGLRRAGSETSFIAPLCAIRAGLNTGVDAGAAMPERFELNNPGALTMTPLDAAVLPPGIRSRFLDDVNGLRLHILEAGFEPAGRPLVVLL